MKIVCMYVSKKRPVKAIGETVKKVWDIDPLIVLGSSKLRRLLTLGYATALSLLPSTALAANTGADGGLAILVLMQKASFWVGLGVVVWGIVEAQLDLPGWKSRIMKGVLGYIAILIVPMLFISLRDNLQLDYNEVFKSR